MLHSAIPDGGRLLIDSSIEKIEPSTWDRICPCGNVYHSWEFLRAAERGRHETTRLYYLRFEDAARELLATAVLSVFETKLFGPRLRIAACGIPFPGGQYNVAVRDGIDAMPIHIQIARELERIAAAHKTHFLLLKELSDDDLWIGNVYRDRGFLLASSLPLHRVDIRWSTFQQYSQSLKCRHRRDVNSALQSMGTKQPELLSDKDYHASDPLPRFVIGGSDVCTADEFYTLYGNLAQHAKLQTFQLEQRDFFRELYRLKGLRVLAIKHLGVVQIAALLLQRHQNLIGVFVGRNSTPNPALHPYPNLIHGAIQFAIQRGCTSLQLGQTTDEPKLRRGSKPEKLYFMIRARNPLINRVLHRFQTRLFPEYPLPTVQAFHRDP